MLKSRITHDEMPIYNKDQLQGNAVLKLGNFRCHGDVEVTIPTNSTTLITGLSGAGKTSVLEAFSYILYNSVIKPEKFGTKKCYGWLFHDGLIVYRQKSPHFLKCIKEEVEYVDDEAQAIINKIYGSSNIFDATSYLRQGQFSPLIDSTDAGKMAIIKTIAYKDDPVDEMKARVKEEVDRIKEAYNRHKSQLEISLLSLSQFDKEHPGVISHEIDTVDREEKIAHLREKKIILETAMESSIKTQTIYQVFQERAENETAEIQRCLDDISNIGKVEELASILASNQKQLSELSNPDISENESNRKSLTLRLSEIDKLISNLNIDPDTNYDECKLMSENEASALAIIKQSGLDSIEEINSKIDELNSELIGLVKEVDKQLLVWENRKLKCPKCEADLVVSKDGKSLEITEAPKPKKSLGGLVKFKPVITEIDITQEQLYELVGKKVLIQEQHDKLTKISDSFVQKTKDFFLPFGTYIPLFSKISEWKSLHEEKSKIDDILSAMPKPETDTENIRIKLSEDVDEIISKMEEIKRLTQEQAQHSFQRDQFILMRGEKQQTDYDNLKKDRDIIQGQIDCLMHLSGSEGLVSQRLSMEKLAKEKAAISKSLQDELTTCIKLQEYAVTTERSLVQEAVDQINVEIGKYVQALFPGNPISIELSTTRKLKTKVGVSNRFYIRIFYKNCEYDKVSQLSGGEKSRVSIAITLALNMISGSPFIFLDETLSSLDADLRSESVSLLKQMAKNKTCVVISHEETEGLYDNILRLEA